MARRNTATEEEDGKGNIQIESLVLSAGEFRIDKNMIGEAEN